MKEWAWRRHGLVIAAVCGVGLVASCATGEAPGAPAASVATAGASPGRAQELDLVACQLPFEVDRLGSQLTKLGAGQQVRISRDECIARKGEIVSAAEKPAPPAPGSGAPVR